MTLDDTKIFARSIAESALEINDTKQNISPDDPNANLSLFQVDQITMSVTYTLNGFTYTTDAFVLGHPVYSLLAGSYILSAVYSDTSTLLYTVSF